MNSFKFQPVAERDILKYLRRLKRKCATGVDNLPTCYLKDAANVIAKPLTFIINLSLETGIFPNDLKLARIASACKSGAKDSFDNYRPISILPALSKIFEKCIHEQLMDHLGNNQLLSDRQFGFRRNRSTEQATALFTDQIRTKMDKGHLAGAIFIDMSKAFDTISHASIVNKLHAYGISGTEHQWLTSYLFTRKQQVSFLGTTSGLYPIYCGVPQGSKLGPFLFLLHFNDAAESLRHCGIVMYADDTVIFCADTDHDVIQKHLEEDFSSLTNWLAENELIINCKKGKTEVMIFGSNQRLKNWIIAHYICNTILLLSMSHKPKNIWDSH